MGDTMRFVLCDSFVLFVGSTEAPLKVFILLFLFFN